MTNKLSDYQNEVFFELYKTSLSALLSSEQYPDNMFMNTAISDATKIALKSIELLTNEKGFKNPSEIIDALQKRSLDEPLEFPSIDE